MGPRCGRSRVVSVAASKLAGAPRSTLSNPGQLSLCDASHVPVLRATAILERSVAARAAPQPALPCQKLL